MVSAFLKSAYSTPPGRNSMPYTFAPLFYIMYLSNEAGGKHDVCNELNGHPSFTGDETRL